MKKSEEVILRKELQYIESRRLHFYKLIDSIITYPGEEELATMTIECYDSEGFKTPEWIGFVDAELVKDLARICVGRLEREKDRINDKLNNL